MAITFAGATKRFGETTVFSDLDAEVAHGEFVAIVGPSGCGKSTLLNAVAGTVRLDGGEVRFDEGDDEVSYVFQSPRLLDWRTVRQNLTIVLAPTDVPESDYDSLIDGYLEAMNLGDVGDMYPRELSGGMQSRIGLIRGLLVGTNTVLMDEPLGDVDELTARKIRQELLDLWGEGERTRTILWVTHDVFEAVYLADRVLVMGHKPTTALAEVPVDVDRPRDPEDEALFALQNRVYDVLPD